MDNNCLFCKIVAGQIPGSIVYQDDNVMVFRDRDPQAPVHLLVIPKRHIASMAALTSEDGPILTAIFMAARNVAREQGLEQGYRFVTNVGLQAGQSVFHLHFHLLGGRDMTWPPG